MFKIEKTYRPKNFMKYCKTVVANLKGKATESRIKKQEEFEIRKSHTVHPRRINKITL